MNKQPRQVIPVAPRTYAKLVKEYTESDYAKLEHKRNEERRKLQCQIKELNLKLDSKSHLLELSKRMGEALEEKAKRNKKVSSATLAFSVCIAFGVGLLVGLGF
jgi:hypothetical protein